MLEIRAPKACGLYLPGHSPHWIQPRKGWEDQVDVPVACQLIGCRNDGLVTIEIGGSETRLWNHQPDRLRDAAKTSNAVIEYQDRWHLLWVGTSPGSRYVFCVARWSDGHVPCPPNPTAGSLVELLNTAGGFSVPVSELVGEPH
jgi:hypothetical protein